MIGRPGVIHLTPGNASDVKTAPAVLARAPGRVRRLIADKGYDADWLRQDLREQGISMVIPGTRARKRKIRFDKRRYRDRWRVEAVFCRLIVLGLGLPRFCGRLRGLAEQDLGCGFWAVLLFVDEG